MEQIGSYIKCDTMTRNYPFNMNERVLYKQLKE